MNLKQKLLLALASIIIVWIATPIPEGAIIMFLLGGATGYTVFPDWRFSVATSIVGCIAGSVIFWKLQIGKKVRLWASRQKEQ